MLKLSALGAGLAIVCGLYIKNKLSEYGAQRVFRDPHFWNRATYQNRARRASDFCLAFVIKQRYLSLFFLLTAFFVGDG
jgi:hypothetical protein